MGIDSSKIYPHPHPHPPILVCEEERAACVKLPPQLMTLLSSIRLQVCADGVFRVLKNDALSPSDTLLASAAVNVNDVEITIVQVALTVVDNSTFTDMYQVCATSLPCGLLLIRVICQSC